MDYLRVSTEEQKKGFGVAAQGKKTRRHIGRKRWNHVATYADEGISGSLEMQDRPDLIRLMEDARNDQFDVVVVPEGRGIGRVGRAFWRWVWALEDLGIFVAIVDGDVDNTTPEGRREMRRQADYAETEWEAIRSRTQGGLQEKAEVGGAPHIGGKPPFGYRIRDQGKLGLSRLVIDEVEATVVRLVYTWVVEHGVSFRDAAIRLSAKKSTTRSGKQWTYPNLRDRILSGPVLNGELVFRGDHAKKDADGNPIWGETVRIQLPRILTPEEASALRKSVRGYRRRSGPNRAFYPLTGRIIGLCGAPYTGISREAVQGCDRFYRCNGKKEEVPGAEVCGCSYVEAPLLESRVWAEVVKLLGNSDRLGELVGEWVGMAADDQTAHTERIAELDKQIASMNSAISAVIVATANQHVDSGAVPGGIADAVTAATAALNGELAQLKEMREDAAAWLVEKEEADERAKSLQQLAQRARREPAEMEPEDQAEIISLLDLKVIFEGPVPVRTGGVPCTVQAWYRSAGLDVPAADLSDAEWAQIAPLLPPERKGKRAAVRRCVNALLYKARSGISWSTLPDEYGSQRTASAYFSRWVKDGTWARVNEVLADITRVPLPTVGLLPPMRVEDRFDPRVDQDQD
ncbi:recombinase family protein [Streptomyces rectiverticillatus]|uniref:recombinase family protein n=1 Tax=Streptomyces rectiverticillatus TaxID=173860 RepID=UPI001FE7CEC1|nr:recombinase family protein [Streptomyces rectiverticillatus]